MTKDERRDKRIPIGLRVRFKSATIAEFIEQYSRDLSRGGIFIRADSPMPIGTLIKFDIRLQDEKSLIQGVGRVVWRREENVSDEAPSGMGIKFIKLDESSRANLDVIMGDSQQGEGKPPGEAPQIVETHDEEDDEAPPQPIAPVRPQSVPKGAKGTIIGMGPRPRGASGAPEPVAGESSSADASGEGAPAGAGEAAAAGAPRAGDFLADISTAIDNALGSGDSSPPTAGAAPAEETPAAAAAPAEEAKAAVEDKAEAPAEAPVAAAKPAEEAKAAVEDKAEAPSAAAAPVVEAKAAAEPKATPKPAERREEAKPSEKPVEPAAVRIGADTKERRGVPPIVWLLLLAGAAGVIYYFGFYTPTPAGTEEPAVADVNAEPPKAEPPKAEPPKAEPPKPEPPVVTAKVDVTTSPAGATVSVDGTARDGVTPLVIDGLQPQKEVTIEARLFGYAPSVQKVVPGEGEPLKVEMKLAPVRVELEFKSDPPGAQVKSGDKWLCKTPKAISQKGMTSDLAYTLSKPGYQDVSGSVSRSDFSFADGAYKALVEVKLVAVEKPAEPPKAQPPKAEPPKAEPPKAEPPKPEPPKAEPPKQGGGVEEDPYG